MKYRFFLKDFPLLFLVSMLIIFMAEHRGKNQDYAAQLVEYEKMSVDFGDYQGAFISDSTSEEVKDLPEDEETKNCYFGSDIEDNGLPYCIKVNKKRNVVTVFTVGADGFYSVPYRTMVCSVGIRNNTPVGQYSLGYRSEWLPLVGGVYGQYASRITGNFLFHSVPYYSTNKWDLEVEEYNKLGEAASAGCVRLAVIDAKWIYDNCEDGTCVEIFESDYDGPLGKPVAEKIMEEKKHANWDPTDSDLENPYLQEAPLIFGVVDREVDRCFEGDVKAGISALDAEGNDITDRIKVSADVDFHTYGTYKITYSVKDKKGNEANESAVVKVVDQDMPEIKEQQVIFKLAANDVSSVEQLHDLLLQNVAAYDGEDELSDDCIVMDYSEILDTTYGMCNVKYCAKDAAGNASRIVTMPVEIDMESPTLQLKDAQQGEIFIDDMLKDDYLLSLVQAEDNSGNAKISISRPLTYAENEPYKVIYYATDDFGNVTTLSVAYHLKKK